MFFFAKFIHYIFFFYTMVLMARIVGSWFPAFSRHRIMYYLFWATEPYLGLFRRVIPPIGGTLDLSPLLAFFALQLLEKLSMSLLVWTQ